MPKIYVVRHGKAAASFTDDLDPGLDELGVKQARETALLLKERVLEEKSQLTLVSSPLKRARETAQPLADLLGLDITIDNRIAEIPSPGLDLSERGSWLQAIMGGKVDQLDDELIKWRQEMIQCLLQVGEDTAFFSHFVAINLLVGAAESSEDVMVFRPDNGSITLFETDGHNLILIERGLEAQTKVN